MQFIVTTTDKFVTVRASGFYKAAQIAARKLYGHRKTITATRVSGLPAMSGYFQAYLSLKSGGQTSWGEQFHVRQD